MIFNCFFQNLIVMQKITTIFWCYYVFKYL